MPMSSMQAALAEAPQEQPAPPGTWEDTRGHCGLCSSCPWTNHSWVPVEPTKQKQNLFSKAPTCEFIYIYIFIYLFICIIVIIILLLTNNNHNNNNSIYIYTHFTAVKHQSLVPCPHQEVMSLTTSKDCPCYGGFACRRGAAKSAVRFALLWWDNGHFVMGIIFIQFLSKLLACSEIHWSKSRS